MCQFNIYFPWDLSRSLHLPIMNFYKFQKILIHYFLQYFFLSFCSGMQDWLPAVMKARLVRQGLVRRKVVCSDGCNLRRWGTHVSNPLLPSQCRGRGSRTERSRGRCGKALCVQTSAVHSDRDLKTGQAMRYPDLRHPRFTAEG